VLRRNWLGHLHRGSNDQPWDPRVSGRDYQGRTYWEHAFGASKNGMLDDTFDLAPKEVAILVIDSSIHEAMAIRRRDDAMARDREDIAALDIDFRIRREFRLPCPNKSRVDINKVQFHPRSIAITYADSAAINRLLVFGQTNITLRIRWSLNRLQYVISTTVSYSEISVSAVSQPRNASMASV
jgi:hypothetical protein